jgi:RsiW-degrading membrane proteinase PrsW (M82 family)
MTARHGFDRHHAEDIFKQSGDAAAHVWADVRSFQFKWIVPYETVLSAAVLRNPITWVMLLFGFGPLLCAHVVTSPQQTLVSVMIYFALAWTAYFFVFVAHRTTDLRVGLGAAAFTVFVGVPVGMLLKRIPPLSLFYALKSSDLGIERLVGLTFADGLNEELLKALVLWLLAFRLKRIVKPSDGMFYGALSGLGFAVFEGYKYVAAAQDPSGIIMQMLLRTTALPFLHATFTAINGYFISLATVTRRRRVALCALGLAVASVLHGAYDFASGISEVFIAAFTYLLLVSYIYRSQAAVQELEDGERAHAEAVASHAVGFARQRQGIQP